MVLDLSGSILESLNTVISGGTLVVMWVKLTQLQQKMDDHIEAGDKVRTQIEQRINTLEERIYDAKRH